MHMEGLGVPHGGRLIERNVEDEKVQADLFARAGESPSLVLDQTAMSDVEMRAKYSACWISNRFTPMT
jgi:ATP sulfurylase